MSNITSHYRCHLDVTTPRPGGWSSVAGNVAQKNFGMDSQRALLDALMGSDRNLAKNEKAKKRNFYDHDVCKYYICGFCPHELFVNTKAALGV